MADLSDNAPIWHWNNIGIFWSYFQALKKISLIPSVCLPFGEDKSASLYYSL